MSLPAAAITYQAQTITVNTAHFVEFVNLAEAISDAGGTVAIVDLGDMVMFFRADLANNFVTMTTERFYASMYSKNFGNVIAIAAVGSLVKIVASLPDEKERASAISIEMRGLEGGTYAVCGDRRCHAYRQESVAASSSDTRSFYVVNVLGHLRNVISRARYAEFDIFYNSHSGWSAKYQYNNGEPSRIVYGINPAFLYHARNTSSKNTLYRDYWNSQYHNTPALDGLVLLAEASFTDRSFEIIGQVEHSLANRLILRTCDELPMIAIGVV